MKEIIYDQKRYGELTESSCQVCGGRLYHTNIPCPEQREGCMVAHYGYKCYDCGRIYQ